MEEALDSHRVDWDMLDLSDDSALEFSWPLELVVHKSVEHAFFAHSLIICESGEKSSTKKVHSLTYIECMAGTLCFSLSSFAGSKATESD